MLKKFLLIVLAVLTVLSLVACDDDGDGIVNSKNVTSVDIVYYENVDSPASKTVSVTARADIKKLCKVLNVSVKDGTKTGIPMDFPRYALAFHLSGGQTALYIDAGGVASVTGVGNIDLQFEQSFFDDITEIYNDNLN